MDLKLTTMFVELNSCCSYRKTVEIVNSFLNRTGKDKIAERTTSEYIVRFGKGADSFMDAFSREILKDSVFDPETLLPRNIDTLPSGIRLGNPQPASEVSTKLQGRIDKYNNLESHKDCPITSEIARAEMALTEDPAHTVYISCDDICTNSQKMVHVMRSMDGTHKAEDLKAKEDENLARLKAAYSEYIERGNTAVPEDNYAEADASADLEEAAAEVDEQDRAEEMREKNSELESESETGPESKAGQEKEDKFKPKPKGKGRKSPKKPSRKISRSGRQYSRVWHTHVEIIEGATGKVYRIHAIGKVNALRQTLAFLVKNNMLEGNDIVFLTDGADDLRLLIEKYFAFRQFRIILDWYHVKKKSSEHISMAFKCKLDVKREIKRCVFVRLWAGQVDAAIEYLNGLEVEKNEERFNDLIGYLTRKKPYIPCYAIRRMLKLHNSSQFVEKTNDMIVAARQKHNGMSWSWDGGNASASLRTLEVNGELESYLRTGTIRFEPVEPSIGRTGTCSTAA